MISKRRIETVLTPIAVRSPFGPNGLTALGVLVMIAAAAAVINGAYIAAAVLVLLSGFLDVLDGTLAKARGRTTALGSLFDRVADRASDALIFGSVILAGLVTLWIGLFVLALVMLASYASACLEAATRTHVGEALSMRAVRLLLVVAGLLLLFFVNWMEYVFGVILVLSAFALVQRLWVARKTLKS